MSMGEIQWVFMGVFNYYILQLRSQRAPSAFDKASYFTLARVSVKWERVRLIDRGSVEMMHFPCDCFHSHYSQHRVISRPVADTCACARAMEPSHRRVRLPLPQHRSLIARLNQWAKIMDYVHSYQSACQGKEVKKDRQQPSYLWKSLEDLSLTFCLLDVIVLPVKGILGGICLCWPRLASAHNDPLTEVTPTDTRLFERFRLSLSQEIKSDV